MEYVRITWILYWFVIGVVTWLCWYRLCVDMHNIIFSWIVWTCLFALVSKHYGEIFWDKITMENDFSKLYIEGSDHTLHSMFYIEGRATHSWKVLLRGWVTRFIADAWTDKSPINSGINPNELICIMGQTWIIFHDISLHIIFRCELVLWNLLLMDEIFYVDDLYSLKCCYYATCYMNCELLDWTNFIAYCSLWRFGWVVMSARISILFCMVFVGLLDEFLCYLILIHFFYTCVGFELESS